MPDTPYRQAISRAFTPYREALQVSPDYGVFGRPSLASGNNGNACWIRGHVSPLDQKSMTGWLAMLYGGIQNGDDWARVNIPVYELPVTSFETAQWSYYMTNTETMGVNIVIWVHDPDDFDKRAEITQLANVSGLEKAAGWNAHELDTTVTQFFFYGEGTTGTGLTAGTQYTWDQFQADAIFSTWTIYRITIEYGWEASGTFEEAYVADIKLNGFDIPLMPDAEGSGRVMIRRSTAASGAIALTLAPKTLFTDLSVSVHVNTAPTTSENFTVTNDSGIGATYDELLDSQDLSSGSLTDYAVTLPHRYFDAADEIDIAYTNTDGRTYGVEAKCRTVF